MQLCFYFCITRIVWKDISFMKLSITYSKYVFVINSKNIR